MRFLVYLYYTQPFYRTSTFSQNHAYCIQMFTVNEILKQLLLTHPVSDGKVQ